MDYLTPPTVPLLEEQELRRFVLGVVDGQIFTTAHFRGRDFEQVGVLVFIPLIGGLDPVAGVHVPAEPEAPTPPVPKLHLEHPPEPEPEPEPDEPVLKEPDPEFIAELEFRIRWGHAREGAIENYKADITAENEKTIAEYDREMEAHKAAQPVHYDKWKAECAEVDERNKTIDLENAEALAAWEAENAEALAQQAEWKDLCERWRQEHIGQIGVIYEWMSKAGPRSVNGYPMFFSCHLLHRDDWERAKKAIDREIQRRETIEI